MANTWKGSRIDGKRESFKLTVGSGSPNALAAHARARFQRRWQEVEEAMRVAGETGVRFGQNAIITRRKRRTGKLHDEFKFKLVKNKRGKARLEIGWLDWSGKPYHIWQEKGTLDSRVRGVGGKKYDRLLSNWTYTGAKSGRGIDPMLVLPDARRIVNETFRSELGL